MNEQVIVKNNQRSYEILLSKRNTIAQLLEAPPRGELWAPPPVKHTTSWPQSRRDYWSQRILKPQKLMLTQTPLFKKQTNKKHVLSKPHFENIFTIDSRAELIQIYFFLSDPPSTQRAICARFRFSKQELKFLCDLPPLTVQVFTSGFCRFFYSFIFSQQFEDYFLVCTFTNVAVSEWQTCMCGYYSNHCEPLAAASTF